MGVRVKVLDPTPDCPASIMAEQMLGSFRDPAMIRFACCIRYTAQLLHSSSAQICLLDGLWVVLVCPTTVPPQHHWGAALAGSLPGVGTC